MKLRQAKKIENTPYLYMIYYPDKWNRARRRIIKYQRKKPYIPRIFGKTLIIKEVDFASIELRTDLFAQLREFYDSTPKPDLFRSNN